MFYKAPGLSTAQVPEVDKKRETWASLGEGIQSGYMSYTLSSSKGVIYMYICIGSIRGIRGVKTVAHIGIMERKRTLLLYNTFYLGVIAGGITVAVKDLESNDPIMCR